jgi:hypothetical protein
MVPAVLVLGAGINEDGKPLEAFEARLDMAIKVVERFAAPLVIVAGRGGRKNPVTDKYEPYPFSRTEASAGMEYLRSRGLKTPPVHVLQENLSTETVGNFVFASLGFLQPLRVNKVVTITSPGHSNRCHRYANRLWGTKIEHVVIHAGPVSITTEMKELALSDYVSDFVSQPKTNTYEGALEFVRERNKDKCADYYSTDDARSHLLDQLATADGTLYKLVHELSDPTSKLFEWMNAFAHPHEIERRRRLYRAFVEKTDIRTGDCERVMTMLGELGVLARHRSDPGVCAWCVHQVPIKFRRIFDDDFLASQSTERRHSFEYILALCLDYLIKLGRQYVEIRAGQGSIAHVPIRLGDLPSMHAEAIATLRRGGWL